MQPFLMQIKTLHLVKDTSKQPEIKQQEQMHQVYPERWACSVANVAPAQEHSLKSCEMVPDIPDQADI